MILPNNHELLSSFTAFLVESGLSSVSIKNYLSDIRHFIRHLEANKSNDLQEVFQNITKYINNYVLEQKTLLTPIATTNRRLASVRRLATYLTVKYGIVNSVSSTQSNLNNELVSDDKNISSKKILEQFKQHLINDKKSHSTVKNYLSDLYHYFAWIANQTPYNSNHLEQVLSNEQLQNYITYQKLVHTSTSVISRRQSSIKKLTTFCFDQGFIPKNPFAIIITEAKVSPLSWFKRYIPKATKPQNASKNLPAGRQGALAIAYHKYNALSFTPYFHLALLVIATTAMGILFYNQIIKSAKPSLAATSLTPPKRQLSFQGRLLDSSGTPITVPMSVNFKLWDDLTVGSQLYTTGTCSVTPDQDGIFNSLIGDGVCGVEIPQSVFTDNRDVYLAVTVGAETLTPRQQIATVGYALNSETLQGYPASASATINTVPVVDNLGNITIAAASPSLVSTSGNFNIKGQALSLTTELNSGGDIVIQPDALASGQILAISGTTTEDSFRISNSNLTTGTLISGYIGNDTATGSGNLISLSSGATESAKFWVTADGRTSIATATESAITSAFIINQNGIGDIFSASSSGLTKFHIDNMGRLSIIDGVAHTIDDVTGNLTLTSNSNTITLNDNVTIAGTTTLNSQTYTWPASAGSNTYVLQTNGSGTLSWVAQTGGGGPAVNQGWTWLAGVLYPTNTFDAINVGNAATASATVHLAGVAGDNSFINGGSFGIGDTTPDHLLDVAGNIGLDASSYINWGDTDGTAGYGFRDNGGSIEFKNSAGAWTGIGSGSGSSDWSMANGTIYPNSISSDLLIGGQATSSAKFAVLNMNSGTPTASIAGTVANQALFFDGNGNISATNRQDISLGNSSTYNSTGDILLNSNGVGRVAIGTTNPLATLDLRGNLGTIPVASISGNTNFPALLVDQSGTGDIFSASSSGQTRFKISNNGTITTSLGTGILHSSSLGVLSSSAINLASSDVSGILPIINGGTNNNNIISPYVSNKFLAFDGTRFVSTGYDSTSFEVPLTFSNGLTRTVNNVALGGTLTATTNIAQAGFDMIYSGSGNFGIGVALPSQKLDVAGVFVVDSVTGRVGIGTTTPTTTLDIAGASSTIGNSTGDLNFNAASNLLNFSGDSLNNFLNATASGQIQLGNFITGSLPTGNGDGALVYNTSTDKPMYFDGSSWLNIQIESVPPSGSYGFWQRASNALSPSILTDSINIGSTATSSALIHLSAIAGNNSFFTEPLAIGFNTAITDPGIGGGTTALQVDGDILPGIDDDAYLGKGGTAWSRLYLSNGINNSGGTEQISILNRQLAGGQWNATSVLRVGDTVSSVPAGIELYVEGDATVSASFGVGGTSSLLGNVTIGNGTGKLDVGLVDPPYTINGEKYATYMSGMVGVKEETAGILATNEYVEGLGYKKTINFNNQEKGSDLWLFSKTTNIKENITRLSVLLTPNSQTKTWYNIDENSNTLTIFSSSPANISYRLTAPRFDDASWTNTRASGSDGYIINNPNTASTIAMEENINYAVQIANIDGSYKIFSNGQELKETSSYANSLIANLKAGIATINELVADNIITSKLISPIASIDELSTINATVSGTLYADNIKSKAIDKLNEQLGLLDEKYATASAILASLQNQYSEFSLNNPLELSPLATTSATLPTDLALNSIRTESVITQDLLANGSIFTPALSSFDTDLFIQPNGDKPVHLLANLMTLYPDGKVVVAGDLIVTGNIFANNIDTRTATVSGTLAVGNGEMATDSANILALFNNNGDVVGSVDASGSANFGQLTTGGIVIAAGNQNTATFSGQTNSNSTIGIASIATGSSEIIINNTNVTDNTLVYITPVSDTDNQVLYVKSKQTGVGFTVAVPQAVTKETSFNFWLVQTK